MFSLALALQAAVMLWLFRQHCLVQGRLRINPLFGLLMGSFYYVVLPCTLIGYMGELVGGITVYDNYFTEKNATFALFFWAIALLLVGLGVKSVRSRVHPAVRRAALSKPLFRVGTNRPFYLLCAAMVFFLIAAFQIRDSLFAGYDPAVLDNEAVWQVRGSMSSIYSMMAVLQLALLWLHWRAPLSHAKKWTMLFFFVLSSALLLSLGARLYVIMALLSFTALYSEYHGGIRVRSFVSLLVVGFTIFGGIGVIRMGSIDGLGAVLMNVVTEPTLTSISAFSLISDNEIPLIGKPYLFPVDFQAIIPSVLLPGKELLFERLKDYGYAFEAPLGGYHLLFSVLINFGVLGTLLMAFLSGIGLGLINVKCDAFCESNIRFALISASLTGMLAFSVFRDPFFISLAKNILLVSIILPWILVRFIRLAIPREYKKFRSPETR
jgi:hypothetical protein